jgi:hypothetical protein
VTTPHHLPTGGNHSLHDAGTAHAADEDAGEGDDATHEAQARVAARVQHEAVRALRSLLPHAPALGDQAAAAAAAAAVARVAEEVGATV